MSSLAKNLVLDASNVEEMVQHNPSGGTSKMSFTVVYNVKSKRVTLSKKLAEVLKLEDTAQLSIVEKSGVIIVGKIASDDPKKRLLLELKDEKDKIKGGVTGKKIAYNADAAYAIATAFQLDYTKHSSKSFDKIEIDNSDPDNPLAIITIKQG